MLTPHLNAQTAQIDQIVATRVGSVGQSTPLDPVLTDFNHLLHELRTVELRQLPVDHGVLLSAGCAGRWYFDWLEECAGPFECHIGVELYGQRPEGLPSNVRWIAESASTMPTVEDGSVDVVFSGQNLEHLWSDDLTGFIREARRVLRPGGMLVVDSPNRIAVEALGWVQPEHTIELSASEATELLELSGFDVEIARGLWNCRDQRTGEWLPLQSPVGEVRSMLDRVATRRSIDDSFVWWLEARRSARPVDDGAVRDRVEQLFERHWNRRVNRAAECIGERGTDEAWTVPQGSRGRIYRTQGFPLFPGVFRVVATSPMLTVNVLSGEGLVLASGTGCAEGTLSTAEFGVTAELVADDPLTEALNGVRIAVDMST